MRNRPMMKCGHAANGTHPVHCDHEPNRMEPCCVICAPSKEAYEIDENPPDLRAREARCECDARRPSSLDLPFFEHRPSQPFDSFYCGCRGWN